jgi:hypothetical protein
MNKKIHNIISFEINDIIKIQMKNIPPEKVGMIVREVFNYRTFMFFFPQIIVGLLNQISRFFANLVAGFCPIKK